VIKELLENETISSRIFNVADNKSLSTNDLIQIIGQSLGKKNKILNIPSSWINRMAKLGDFLHLPLNSERLQKLTENYVVSNSKIVVAIGKPLPVTAEEGLLKTFESFQK
jgi:nucleoside-diphosphate-sugar epimerase